MYTHLTQFQASCWKYWNIQVPNSLFERKEYERINPNLIGWWGPAKGVPILVFIISDITFPVIVPTVIKQTQETVQSKIRHLFQALHLVPHKNDSSNNTPVEVKSLFVFPSTSQPAVHIVPAAPKEVQKKLEYSSTPPSLSDYLKQSSQPEPQSNVLYQEYGDKLLRNYVTIWTNTAVSRHPLHTNYTRKGADKYVPLPTPIQIISAMVPLLAFIFNRKFRENGNEFRKLIGHQYPSTKGMMQQIEVILRKKIKDYVEIEKVFSRNHSMNIMQKCNDAYLQDSPPFYTQQYHTWKLNNVMRLYRSLARGPCMEEYAVRLERECEAIWKQGRQSCESLSLTGRSCRLKIGHEKESASQKQVRDDRSILIDNTKHNSGFNFFHACTCGKTQRIREDPFDIKDANITFYRKFNCCLGKDIVALDIMKSQFGDHQQLVLTSEEIPEHDCALLYLGSASTYKNNIGLDKMEGFMSSTNFLIPWCVSTVNDLKLRQEQEQALSKVIKSTPTISNGVSVTDWPALGKGVVTPSKSVVESPPVPSLIAFPALGTNPSSPSASTPINNTPPAPKQLFDTRRRRRHDRMRDRLQRLIRGYVGAEYECPQGHRFLSCGDGRVCRLGHASHPKEHGNYFVHQDLSIYFVCPCTFANTVNTKNTEVIAQLQRLYIVTPSEGVTLSIEPRIKINLPGTDEVVEINLDITDALSLGPNSTYVLRLPFIYRNKDGKPIPIEPDVQKRLKGAMLQKDCIKFHYKEAEKWV
ncbi:hypothetical protein BDB01DRAFT_842883 [Pilobolus umbonatus]|nr:hypothetical protein BDB01DRAFT_842883 [Pilobolus umbonatus]